MIQEFGTAANQSYPPFIFTHGYDRVPVMASSHRGDRGDYWDPKVKILLLQALNEFISIW